MDTNVVEFPCSVASDGLTNDEIQKAVAFGYRLIELGLATEVASEIGETGHKKIVITGPREIQFCKGGNYYAAFLGRSGGVIAGRHFDDVLERTAGEFTQRWRVETA